MRLKRRDLWLFDFDGVIKDSNSVKGEIFSYLFRAHPEDALKKIVLHHTTHPQISRERKIRLYLEYVGLEVIDGKVNDLVEEFGRLSERKVAESEWVPGVLDFIVRLKQDSRVGIVSAMPSDELERLVSTLGMTEMIDFYSGYPVSKESAICAALEMFSISPEDTLFFGDARSDLEAASKTGIGFCLVKNHSNQTIASLCDYAINDFMGLEVF